MTKAMNGSVPIPEAHTLVSKTIVVDDLTTHYLEGGSGPTVVLLHSGEFGSCADMSWEYNFAALSSSFKVIAPDWLGFGRTAKVFDFEDSFGRRLRHMTRFLSAIGVDGAHFIGNSMGAAFLLRDASTEAPHFPCRSIVAISGGGFVPDNEWRRALVDYNGDIEEMRLILRALFHDLVWSTDPAYVQRRHDESVRAGAWECTAAARLRSPSKAPRPDYGLEDPTPYEKITVPVLLITGNDDRLKLPQYGRELRDRITSSDLVEVDNAGHCAQIEQASQVNDLITDFLRGISI